jgi:hypothetical protein
LLAPVAAGPWLNRGFCRVNFKTSTHAIKMTFNGVYQGFEKVNNRHSLANYCHSLGGMFGVI